MKVSRDEIIAGIAIVLVLHVSIDVLAGVSIVGKVFTYFGSICGACG